MRKKRKPKVQLVWQQIVFEAFGDTNAKWADYSKHRPFLDALTGLLSVTGRPMAWYPLPASLRARRKIYEQAKTMVALASTGESEERNRDVSSRAATGKSLDKLAECLGALTRIAGETDAALRKRLEDALSVAA